MKSLKRKASICSISCSILQSFLKKISPGISIRRTSLAFSLSGVQFWIHNDYHFHEIWIWWTHSQVSGGILSDDSCNQYFCLLIYLTLVDLKDDANIISDLTNEFQKYWKREKVGHASYISLLILLLCESGSGKMFHAS